MIDIVDNPIGDMVIRVGRGDDTGFVRVHKNFLTVASPVFRSMLTGGFSEGTKTLDENGPLLLGDDGREAFIDFCKAIHHRFGTRRLSIDRAVEVALIADKYGCIEPVLGPLLRPFRVSVDVILGQDTKPDVFTVNTVLNLILLSYMGNDKDLFWQSSRYAAMNFEHQALEKGWNDNLCHIAPGIIAKVSQLRELLLQDLQKQYDKGLERITSRYRNSGCDHLVSLAGHYAIALVNLKANGNGDLCKSGMSLASAWAKFERMKPDTPGLKLRCPDLKHQGTSLPCAID